MGWYYRLHELPKVKLGGMLVSLLRWVDLPSFYPIFAEANSPLEAEKEMDKRIADLVVYNAVLRGPFPNKDRAVKEAKKEFQKRINEAQQTVSV